jgi:hypothetical protein
MNVLGVGFSPTAAGVTGNEAAGLGGMAELGISGDCVGGSVRMAGKGVGAGRCTERDEGTETTGTTTGTTDGEGTVGRDVTVWTGCVETAEVGRVIVDVGCPATETKMVASTCSTKLTVVTAR